ncbi:hypothetical protein BLNAU_22861 [Blattamonas nauphoetae]|uniref:Uncharacterized protein n=1 Tax=Blattamonas nauphoetae TaxID=2049346 RepID=A0ABQ9WRV6_9EUKA|nr:hypothetical protein BLNAU_22861 [Blattamonas nauphoetae]
MQPSIRSHKLTELDLVFIEFHVIVQLRAKYEETEEANELTVKAVLDQNKHNISSPPMLRSYHLRPHNHLTIFAQLQVHTHPYSRRIQPKEQPNAIPHLPSPSCRSHLLQTHTAAQIGWYSVERMTVMNEGALREVRGRTEE